MFRVSNQNHGQTNLHWKLYWVCSTIFLMFILSITSCAPQIPVPVANTPNSQTQSSTMIAIPTPSMGTTQISPKDGMVMVFVPAGEFEMGSTGAGNQWPIHKVSLDAFWIDQTEVTNEMFAKFVENDGYVTDAEKTGSSNDFFAGRQEVYWEKVKGLTWKHPDGENSNISGLEDHPVVHISWNDANAYGTWAVADCPPKRSGRKPPAGMNLRAKNIHIPWEMTLTREASTFVTRTARMISPTNSWMMAILGPHLSAVSRKVPAHMVHWIWLETSWSG
jgi:hypothetical protein